MFTNDSILLVDADSIYFRIACKILKQNEIRRAIKRTMTEIRKNCGTDKMLVAVKGHGNFRKGLYSEYKANRPSIDEDRKKALTYGHEFMVGEYDARMADDMEADDLVSIWAAECRASEQDYTVVGIDKDLLQIPGEHYNFVKKVHQSVNEDQGNYSLMLQCLTGDSGDNIPGIKGIGPAKGRKLLDGVPMSSRWSTVQSAWRDNKAGDPVLSRSLLTMLTSWEEHNAIMQRIQDKGLIRKPHVREAGEDDLQDT